MIFYGLNSKEAAVYLAKSVFLNFFQTIVSFRELPEYERTTRSTKDQRERKWG
jgi:hypothetical protein